MPKRKPQKSLSWPRFCTLASERVYIPPLDPDLATEILKYKNNTTYVQPTDFVFAVDSGKPRWQETTLADHIKPAAVAAKIQGKVGWHTFRQPFTKAPSTAGFSRISESGNSPRSKLRTCRPY